MKIQRTTMGELNVGDQICNVDDDDLTTDASVNVAYDAIEQEWETVLERTSMRVLLTPDFGTPCTTKIYRRSYQPEQATWRLVTDEGSPIQVDVEWEG